jgi:hypothetical protein
LELATPGGVEAFHVEASDAALRLELPVPAPPTAADLERVAAAAGRHGAELVGPPLG